MFCVVIVLPRGVRGSAAESGRPDTHSTTRKSCSPQCLGRSRIGSARRRVVLSVRGGPLFKELC